MHKKSKATTWLG